MSKDHKRLKIERTTPSYWNVTLNNPPINLYDPEMFAELRVLMDQIEEDKDIKVVVFDSADPDYFISHYDIVRGEVVPDLPGAAPFSEWPAFVTRLAQSRVISIAKVRGRARGHGSELALACDMRFASREKAIFAQIEVGCAVVPGGGATEWLTALAGRSRALEIIVGADDFDAIIAEKYGWVNRALPDAELDGFVDNFARRIASFEKRPLELAKKLVNARAGIPSEAERRSSNQSFVTTTTWPETQALISELLQNGFQQRGDFELRMGHHLGHQEMEVSPMEDEKIYLLAELTILPGFLEEVKTILKEALIPTLQEPGCEALYETGRKNDPHKLVFFEVFSSAEAHEFHLEQDYTKRMFASLEGKLSGLPTLTKLSAL